MARSFNGTTDKIVGAGATPINFAFNQAFTACGWFYLDPGGVGNFNVLFGHLDPANSFCGWELIIHDSTGVAGIANVFYMQILDTSGNADVNWSGFVPTTNTWFHGAGTYTGQSPFDATQISTYTNGVLNSANHAGSGAGLNVITNSIPPNIGMRSGGTVPFKGRIADCAVWNVVLSAGEIAALGSGGMRPNMVRPNALVAWYPLDGLQSTEPDLSGNANNGTLTGTAFAAGPPVTMFSPRWPIFSAPPAAFVYPFNQPMMI